MNAEPERDKPRLSDNDREMCEYFAESGAYYFGFEPTGQKGIDLILGAVCAAGKGHHHTESWGDEDMCSCDAGSYIDLIQAAAAEASERQKELVEALEDANSLCRSAHEVAKRKGGDTHWIPFRDRLMESLERQHRALHPEQYGEES